MNYHDNADKNNVGMGGKVGGVKERLRVKVRGIC